MFTIHAYPLTGWCPYCQKPTAQEYLGEVALTDTEIGYRYKCAKCGKTFDEL